MSEQISPIKTTCPYCGVGCGIEMQPKTQKNEIVWQALGDKVHPANYGKLCVKGSSVGETLSFSGRMLAPQVHGKAVDWEEAITFVADGFRKVIAEHGPDAVAFYVSGQLLTEDYYVANKLLKGFIGTANIDTNSRLCMASAVVGYKRAFGADAVPCSYEDLELADLVVLVGSNAAWAHPIVYQRLVAAKKERPQMKVVVIDPRRTATCDLADLHLPLKPGTDAALFNGLLSYLVASGSVDSDFIAEHTEGFKEACEMAQAELGTLSAVAATCELDEADLLTFFQWTVQLDRMVTLYSQGVNQSSSGVDKSNAIINCHLATGRIGRPGMGPFSITGQPNAMGGREVGGLANQLAAHMDFSSAEDIDRVARFWQARNMAQQNGLKAVDMFQAVAEGKIKAIWIINTNPVVSMPEADKVKAALQACGLVVVSDCMQNTDTTEVADVLLPALTWGETDGMVTNSDRTISRQRRFIDGPELARSDWWMLTQVAKKLGFADAFDYQTPADIFREHAELSGFENDGKRDFDISALAMISNEEYGAFSPMAWPINERFPKGCKRMFADGQFYTPNRKARFIAIQPRLPQNPTSETYPLILNTGRIRDQWHTMTRTAKTAKLMAHIDEPFIQVHPLDAEKYGVTEGCLARVHNDLGAFVGRVVVDAGQRQGSLFVPMHWTAQYASQARADVLVNATTDPLSGQPESKHSPVALEAYDVQWQGFALSRAELETSDFDYWIKIKGKSYFHYELAGKNLLKNDQAWSKLANFDQNLEGLEKVEYQDEATGTRRVAWLKDGQLELVVFVSEQQALPGRHWLGGLFSKQTLEARERFYLLAGQASGAKDEGRTICSCFSVGLNTLVEAIHSQRLSNVEAIGQALKAGTNCGSCIPELTEILDQELHVELH
ncbi:molybdopterin-dependent oxidoreductase [Thiomicrorhabdus sp. ZW0627]|uniref:nitrate reductase n=1 Tax=Thiomicrorhabdus sp. ZW0627 TaxID=3039774 RepID=UPI0024366F7C|nr:nitrate reductase [Thiomicrorhabdus sp. ZW0627]MDG6774129.1 molybdopterin-dependent oxidoreductase [Thiomicrorhabdus sp. ZW0627]